MNHVALLESELQRPRHLDTDPHQPKVYIQRGMIYFKLGHIAEAIADFDRAEHLNPALTPYLWQRGLAYYYAERFADGAKQLRWISPSISTMWKKRCGAICVSTAPGHAGGARGPLTGAERCSSSDGMVYKLFAGECDAGWSSHSIETPDGGTILQSSLCRAVL